MDKGRLHAAARRIAGLLDELHAPYAIAGALALAAHGRVRLSDTVEILVRREDLARLKQAELGQGYVAATTGPESVRDSENGVRIDFLLSGDYPGDRLPKPVTFPDPVGQEAEAGYRVLPLDMLVTLLIASGTTDAHRTQDLADVTELIRARSLTPQYAELLDESVRAKFLELWALAQVREDE